MCRASQRGAWESGRVRRAQCSAAWQDVPEPEQNKEGVRQGRPGRRNGGCITNRCCVLCLVVQSWPTLCNPNFNGDCPGKNTGVGCHAFLQGLIPTHGSNLLLLLSHFSRVRLCATPQTAAHQAPQSLGFSRQEHWSGLPFPSPGSPSVQADSLPSEPPGKPQNTGVGSLSLLQEIFPPRNGTEPGSLALQVDSLPTELPGKPIKTVGLIEKVKISGKHRSQDFQCLMGREKTRLNGYGCKCVNSWISIDIINLLNKYIIKCRYKYCVFTLQLYLLPFIPNVEHPFHPGF